MGLKDNDRAFEFLSKAADDRDSWIATLKYALFFDPIRTDPRYPELLKKLGPD